MREQADESVCVELVGGAHHSVAESYYVWPNGEIGKLHGALVEWVNAVAANREIPMEMNFV